ncbi:MAG: ribonuclease R [Hydrogenoanaerobacterium sp.]
MEAKKKKTGARPFAKSSKKNKAKSAFKPTAKGGARVGAKTAFRTATGAKPAAANRGKGSTVEATIISVKERFGFAGDPELPSDIFIPGRFLMGAMPGDRVLVRKTLLKGGDLTEGEVVRILEENNKPFSGVFAENGGAYEIMPDTASKLPIKVLPKNTLNARDGDKVLARLTVRGDNHFTHQAEVMEIFGSSTKAAACCAAILAGAGIETSFDADALKEAMQIERRGISEKEMAERTDLRDELIFTIDGADTKDIDDAVSLKKTQHGWKLGVHIADVSHYVVAGSAIDAEAFERGTSVYYANSVVPMLPKELSNGICSLNEGEDRLAFSALMTLDESGKLAGYTFKKTIIRSRVKGVYSEINSIIEGNASDDILHKYNDLTEAIAQMHTLAVLLQKRRAAAGGINLQSSEAKIVIDENGVAIDILPRKQGISEGIIEEFMLTANEAAASVAMQRGIPFVYRVHDNPSPDKIEKLCVLLDALGVDCADLKKQLSSAAMAKVLNSVHDSDLELLVNNQILRSMAKAKYSEINSGHFGLVMQNYAHFTSPIRRYPDLSIHRILTSLVTGTTDEALKNKYSGFAKLAAAQSTDREQRAMYAERDCEDCYKAEYMQHHVGDVFAGVISSATAHGLYVRLENTVEGLIRIDALPQGNYDYDGAAALKETASGKTYRVGMPMSVKVAAADVNSGNVDFVPA